MPNATELCSLTDLKTYLKVSSANFDTILQSIKDYVEQAVKTYCARDFLVTSYTEVYDGDGGILLQVRNRPVVSVVSIFSDPTRLFQANSQIPASDIITDDGIALAAGIVRLFLWRYLRGNRSTQISYTAGYATIPADLAMAVKLIAAKTWQVQDKALWTQVRQTIGDLQLDLSVDVWPKDALAILNSYRRITL